MGINTMWPFIGGRSKNEHESSESCANTMPNYTPAPAEQTEIPASEEVANPVVAEEELPVEQIAELTPAVGETTTEVTPSTPLFSAMGSTRMLCADMTVEDAMLPALASVVDFKFAGNNLYFLNADGSAVMTLVKR